MSLVPAPVFLLPRTDGPVLGGPLCASLPGLGPLPLHRPDAGGHGALHHCG